MTKRGGAARQRRSLVAITTAIIAAVAAMAFVMLEDRLPGAAAATTYRCEVDGRVTYADAPCASGRQTTVVGDDGPAAPDKAAAERRRAAERAEEVRFDKQRAREADEARRAAAQARRQTADRARHAQVCARLARRATTAHDAFDLAGPSDQAKT